MSVLPPLFFKREGAQGVRLGLQPGLMSGRCFAYCPFCAGIMGSIVLTKILHELNEHKERKT